MFREADTDLFNYCDSSDLSGISQPESLDWEMAIAKIADIIIAEQSAAKLLVVRGHLYDLITKCIQSSVILKRLTFYLLEKVSDPIKLKIIEKAAYHVSWCSVWIKLVDEEAKLYSV